MTTSEPERAELMAVAPERIAIGTLPPMIAWVTIVELPMNRIWTSRPFSLKIPASFATHMRDWPTAIVE